MWLRNLREISFYENLGCGSSNFKMTKREEGEKQVVRSFPLSNEPLWTLRNMQIRSIGIVTAKKVIKGGSEGHKRRLCESRAIFRPYNHMWK